MSESIDLIRRVVAEIQPDVQDPLRRLAEAACDYADGLEGLIEENNRQIERILGARDNVAAGRYDSPDAIHATVDKLLPVVTKGNASDRVRIGPNPALGYRPGACDECDEDAHLWREGWIE